MIFQRLIILETVSSIALCAMFIVFLTAGSVAASGQSAIWVAGDKLQGFFADRECSKAPSKEALSVGKGFKDFCSRWIGSKNGFAMKSAGNKTNGSTIIKEYSQCGDAYELRITKAKGSNVYVGTLKYIEKVFRAPDGQPGKAGSAPFAVAKEVPVTEFFMFKNGKWCY